LLFHVTDEEFRKLHEEVLFIEDRREEIGDRIDFLSFACLIRNLGAAQGKKFSSVGCVRAAFAVRMLFDFEEVILARFKVENLLKERFESQVSPLLSSSQVGFSCHQIPNRVSLSLSLFECA